MTGVLRRGEEAQTQRQRSEGCGHKPRTSWGLRELEEAGRSLPTEPGAGAWPCRHPASRTISDDTPAAGLSKAYRPPGTQAFRGKDAL